MGDRDLNVVGIISYEDYSLQISSEYLKRVVRGEELHKICGLPDIFSGGLIQGSVVVPVLSREFLDLYITTTCDTSESVGSNLDAGDFRGSNSTKDRCLRNQSPKLLFALLTCDGYDFALPLDEVVSIFDDCQKDKSNSGISRFVALECRGLLNYILLQKGGSNEV